jgi:ribonucleoside-diphosphate reductase beta chain
MESVHAKSYSSIFSTLNTKSEIEEIFAWTNSNELLQNKAKKINDIYANGTGLQRKAASVMLESFLFYSGFYAPLWYLGNNKLANVAEIIKLILRDESVHGTYIGYKFQIGYNQLPEDQKEELKNWVFQTIYELYMNESKFTQEIYDKLGWTEKVKVFIRYNANKALQNLGFDPLFPDTADDVDPIVMNGISTGTSNHDFFSQVGNGYLLGAVEAMEDQDYTQWL